jgi:hypothetical protein
MPGPTFTHSAGVGLNLIEGNGGTGMVEDAIHGTHNLNTYFRNHWKGRDPGKTQQTAVVHIARYARYMNLIGNVMGESGYHTQYQAVTPTTTNCDVSIYNLGFAGGQCQGSGDSWVATTLMRWGNYDTVTTGGVKWDASEVPSGLTKYANPVPGSQNLAASFYLSGQPAFWSTPWGTPTWPAVGPDVIGGDIAGYGGRAWKIPARLCHEHLSTDGDYPLSSPSIRSFNANTCYAR